MPKTRRRFTSEFKSEAVRLLAENGKPLQQVAAELGVHTNQLRMWRNEHLAAAPPTPWPGRRPRLLSLPGCGAR